LKSYYLTIDLEDFTYEMHRIFALELRSNHDALWSCYNLINDFALKHLDSNQITFFTTGVLAENNQDLIKKIVSDGHEIASHYYNHNHMFKQELKTIENEINLAIDAIVKACNIRPIGFRAPAFSIPTYREDIFLIIKKYFRYDSSYVIENYDKEINISLNKDIFDDINFTEFPILTKPYFFNKIHLKSGGSFFRIFGKKTLGKIMENSIKYGFVPIVYLHPYDILSDKEFWFKYEDFDKGYFTQRLKNWIMQNKYLSIGNKNTISKLAYLNKHFEHQGTLRSALKKL